MKSKIFILLIPLLLATELHAQIAEPLYSPLPWRECTKKYYKDSLIWMPIVFHDSVYKKVAIYKGGDCQLVLLRRSDSTWQEVRLDRIQHFPGNAKLVFSYNRWLNILRIDGGQFTKCLKLHDGSLWCECPPPPPAGPHLCDGPVDEK